MTGKRIGRFKKKVLVGEADGDTMSEFQRTEERIVVAASAIHGGFPPTNVHADRSVMGIVDH